MKSNGFTLIEMIAVVMIIALISLISLPTLVNQLGERKNEISDMTLKMIYDAAELYMSDRQSEYSKTAGNSYCVSLDTLVSNGNLSTPITDFKTGDEIPLTKYVKTKINSYLEYSDFQLVDKDEC